MAAAPGRSSRATPTVSLSILLGTLLIPVTAYAASVLIETGVGPEPEAVEPTTAQAPPTEPATTDMAATAADLAAACGEVGLSMVAAETDGSITTFEQAALDALRQVCAERGLALPAKEVSQPTSSTTPASIDPLVSASAEAAPATQPAGVIVEWEEDRDDDDWEFEARYDLAGLDDDD